jgi:hypothetical protein
MAVDFDVINTKKCDVFKNEVQFSTCFVNFNQKSDKSG